MTQIKICGLWRIEDIEVVNEMLPEYIGFVFAKSRRQVTPHQAKLLRQNLDKRIQVVGVFVNEEIEKMVDLVEKGIIDIIQLHGQETEEVILELKKRTQAAIIKAISVTKAEDISVWQKTQADYLLLDGAKAGAGEVFDWKTLEQNVHLQHSFFLAGGIKYENVRDAIGIAKPFAVDMSSGVETDGVKEPRKIREMIRRIRDEER